MGEVWRARDTVLGREVAVKVLKHEYADDPTFRARFAAEARHAAGLHHPGIASVFDYGAAQGGPDALPGDGAGRRQAALRPARRRTALRPRAGPAAGPADRRGARRRPPGGRRAPRREARQPAGHPRGPGQDHRLRHRPGRRTRSPSPRPARSSAPRTTSPPSRRGASRRRPPATSTRSAWCSSSASAGTGRSRPTPRSPRRWPRSSRTCRRCPTRCPPALAAVVTPRPGQGPRRALRRRRGARRPRCASADGRRRRRRPPPADQTRVHRRPRPPPLPPHAGHRRTAGGSPPAGRGSDESPLRAGRCTPPSPSSCSSLGALLIAQPVDRTTPTTDAATTPAAEHRPGQRAATSATRRRRRGALATRASRRRTETSDNPGGEEAGTVADLSPTGHGRRGGDHHPRGLGRPSGAGDDEPDDQRDEADEAEPTRRPRSRKPEKTEEPKPTDGQSRRATQGGGRGPADELTGAHRRRRRPHRTARARDTTRRTEQSGTGKGD